jgi:hypothetical protein
LDVVAFAEVAVEDFEAEGVEDLALDDALQGAGSVGGVVAFLAEEELGGVVEREGDVLLGEASEEASATAAESPSGTDTSAASAASAAAVAAAVSLVAFAPPLRSSAATAAPAVTAAPATLAFTVAPTALAT